MLTNYYFLFFLIHVISLPARFVMYCNMVQPETGASVILIGDVHAKEQYASENRASILNMAKTLDAHVVVEDMSDFSLFKLHTPHYEARGADFFSFHSHHSKKRLAYTSLSLTQHCQRKDISVANVEFRHGTRFDRYYLFSKKEFIEIVHTLLKTISPETKLFLNQEYLDVLHRIILTIKRSPEREEFDLEPHEMTMSEVDLLCCYLIDVLMMQQYVEQMKLYQERPIVFCAGAMHIQGLYDMFLNNGFKVLRKVGGAFSEHELRLETIFDQDIYKEDIPKQKCVSKTSIGFHDKKKVYWSVTKKTVTSGAALTALAGLYYVYQAHKVW